MWQSKIIVWVLPAALGAALLYAAITTHKNYGEIDDLNPRLSVRVGGLQTSISSTSGENRIALNPAPENMPLPDRKLDDESLENLVTDDMHFQYKVTPVTPDALIRLIELAKPQRIER